MGKSLSFFLWGIFILISLQGKATNVRNNDSLKKVNVHSIVLADSLKTVQKKVVYHEKHRLVAALLAFPLGIFGLHRMYMHTSKKVPFLYIITVGGGFGILPFIDFVLILLNKDIHLNYTSNPHLFMWEKR